MAETDTVRETITIVPVTGAIYHNGQEMPTERWSFELGLNLSEDKILSTVLKRLEKGYGIKDKCAALNHRLTILCLCCRLCCSMAVTVMNFDRGTQRIVSVEYLFGRPVIASNFRLGKCYLELS